MTSPRWLTDPEQRAWYAWRRMFPLINAEISRDLGADSGLSEADYDVLSVLSETPGNRMRVTGLAGLMMWSRSRLSHHLTRMEQRGLVRREEVTSDGRGAEVVLTDAGVAVIHAAAPLHVESVRRHLIDHLTPEELATLAGLGEAIAQRMGVTRKNKN
ncbi:MarR family winged helix-turn-helix transcriptional regulator [Streptomyces sp. NBC_01431]|uniref:MarR family winged helix-turn-helix transcriptional regulator n=1 Tax=Streptomyces sp. NBC_01431 TaxID=2903863 RepID=UPI002E31B753|nr:MarR family transcriptional regulator [Streptomyces sp. NBC_01431]